MQIHLHHPAREEIGAPKCAIMPPGAFGEPERVDKNRCFQIHLDIPFLDAGTFTLMIPEVRVRETRFPIVANHVKSFAQRGESSSSPSALFSSESSVKLK